MTSAINTNGINVNYPVPGVNNSTQGFRDNFATIKTNLDTASTEITNLQNSVVVKQALPGTTINNDMANTLISNAVTRSFRASTYNLGNNLNGILTIDVSQADVQYGSISANTSIQFGGWAPTGTQSKLQLILTFSNTEAVLSFPAQVINSGDYGAATLENYVNGVGNVATVTAPSNSNVVDYVFTTLDCGSNVFVEQVNRPRQSTQTQQRSVSIIGLPGDVTGTTAADVVTPADPVVCTSTDATTDTITCTSTSGFYLDMPIIFTGETFGDISAGVTYYVRTIVSATEFTVGLGPGNVDGAPTIVQLLTSSGSMIANPVTYLYVAARNFNANVVSKTATATTIETLTQPVSETTDSGNLITITDTTSMVENYPITFSASYGNLFVGTTYYVKNIVSSTTFTVSTAIGGVEVNVTTSTPSGMSATYTSDYTISVNSTTNLSINMPVIFTDNTFGGIAEDSVYYINSIDSGANKITISETCYSGIAGQTFNVIGASGTMSMKAYNGQNIFNSVALTPKIGSADVIGLNVVAQNFVKMGVENSIVATGTVKSDAYQLTKNINNITSTPLNSGVILPVAEAGMRITVRNGDGFNSLKIYPQVGGQINTLGVNVSYTLAASAVVEFFCVSGTTSGTGGQWYTY